MVDHSVAIERERRYTQMEERVRVSLEEPTLSEALRALARCPRRTGIPPLSSYFCECPACTPDEWGLDDSE